MEKTKKGCLKMMSPAQQFTKIHAEANDTLRLGQRFVNMYIKNSWPRLFYCEDVSLSYKMIKKWLNDHQYYTELPHEIKR